jgi:hypothetical protein
MRLVSFLLPVLVLAGCAGTPEPEPVANVNEPVRDELVCEKVKVIGSNRPRKVCRYRSEMEREDQSVRMLQQQLSDRYRKPTGQQSGSN